MRRVSMILVLVLARDGAFHVRRKGFAVLRVEVAGQLGHEFLAILLGEVSPHFREFLDLLRVHEAGVLAVR